MTCVDNNQYILKCYFFYQEKLSFELSPVMLMKGRKNPTEISGMRNANIKDAVAIMDFVQHLEKAVKSGKEEWDELKAAKTLRLKRTEQKLNKGLSFATISAYGGNGAVIHYKPNNITNAKIGRDMFLLDSGNDCTSRSITTITYFLSYAALKLSRFFHAWMRALKTQNVKKFVTLN